MSMNCKIVRCNNSDVTNYYLDILGKACDSIDSQVVITVTAKSRDAICAKLINERVIYWVQGIAPEESYMRNQSKIRSVILSLFEKRALKSSDFVVFVSDYMRIHFEKKYRMTFPEDKYYVMPCFNTPIFESSFEYNDKYTNNVFTYIGSMSPWQNFDNILKVYEEIEKLGLPNTKLEIYTSEKDIALEKIKNTAIFNYSIDYVKNEELHRVLSKVKYGFILREDNEVNRVSTPTKISTYLANGVIPIYSKCLSSFRDIARNMQYAIVEEEIINKVIELSSITINKEDIYREYKRLFDTYYSPEHNINSLMGKIKYEFVK